jgi:lipopolysaccharide export system permease protein
MILLERYIHREILDKVAWIIGILVLILASNRFVEYLADAAAGKLPGDLIAEMLIMKLVAMLPRILPIAVFLAVMLAMSRMARDRELTIVSGAGMSEGFQLLAVTHFALLYALLVGAAAFQIAPWAERQIEELKQRARIESDISGVSAGQFREFNEGDRVVYVQALSSDRQSMEGVFLQVRQEANLGVLTSDSAHFDAAARTGSRYIVFRDGRRYVGTPGSLDFQVTEYRNYAVLVEQGAGGGAVATLETLPTGALLRSDAPAHRAELQWRISYVLAALLLPMLGVAMNRFGGAEHRYTQIFVGVLVYFVYSNLLGISRTLLKRDEIPPVLGLWWVHLALFAAILLLVWHEAIRRALRRLVPARRTAA